MRLKLNPNKICEAISFTTVQQMITRKAGYYYYHYYYYYYRIIVHIKSSQIIHEAGEAEASGPGPGTWTAQ